MQYRRIIQAARSNSLPKIRRRNRRPVLNVSQLLTGAWLTAETGSDAYRIVGIDSERVLLAGGYFLSIEAVLRDWYISETLPTGHWPGTPSKGLAVKSIKDIDVLVSRKIAEAEDRREELTQERRSFPLLKKGVL